MTCKNCGAFVRDNMKFCTACGTPIAETADVVQPTSIDATVAVSRPPVNESEQPVATPPVAPLAQPSVAPPPAPAPRPRSNKGLIVVLICLWATMLMALGVVLLIWLWPDGDQSSSSNDTSETTTTTEVVTTTSSVESVTTTLPTAAPTAPNVPVDYEPRNYRVSAAKGAKMYATPSFGATVVGTVAQGRTVYSTECRDYEWVYTTYNGQAGWINISDLRDTATEASYDPPSYNMLGYKGVVETRENTGVNMRRGPATSYPVICGVGEHKSVDIKAYTNGWYYVVYNGNEGWINGDYLRVYAY